MPSLVHEDTQDGRDLVITQKIPGLNRTETGAHTYCPGPSLDQGYSPSAQVTLGVGHFFCRERPCLP